MKGLTLFPQTDTAESDRLCGVLRSVEQLSKGMAKCAEPNCWACRQTLADIQATVRRGLR